MATHGRSYERALIRFGFVLVSASLGPVATASCSSSLGGSDASVGDAARDAPDDGVPDRGRADVGGEHEGDERSPVIGMHTPLGTGESSDGGPTVVRGNVVFRARVTDDVGVDRVEFELAGSSTPLATVAAPGPYRYEWATDSVVNGTYTVNIKAYDAAGNESTLPISLEVNNASHGSTPRAFVNGLIYEQSTGTHPTVPSVSFLTASDHQYIRAIGVIDPWTTLQPEANSAVDFSILESLKTNAHAAGIDYIFILKSGGNGTPAWVELAGTPPPTPGMALYRPYAPATGVGASGSETSVVAWDLVIRDYWVNVTSQVAAHFDDDPSFRGIYVAGCTARYPEMIFDVQPQFLDASVLPPKGILAPFDDADPVFDEVGSEWGQVYSNAWVDTVRLLTTQFQQTRVINMLDELNLGSHGYDVFDHVWSAIQASYEGQVTVGTANLGNSKSVDLTDKKYETLKGKAGMPPVYYEIGPDKVVYGTTSKHGLYDSLMRCGAAIQNCTAALVFASELKRATADSEAHCAACSVWGGPACPAPGPCPP